MSLLNDAEITARLKTVPQWTRDGHKISRQFDCGSFPDAMAFLVRIGFDAEAADHHPDIMVDYKKVTLTFWTHNDGGLTEKDFVSAAAADKTAARFVSAGKAAGV
jgi:4a-hydroxytetrahydrobiopterin dehydratase